MRITQRRIVVWDRLMQCSAIIATDLDSSAGVAKGQGTTSVSYFWLFGPVSLPCTRFQVRDDPDSQLDRSLNPSCIADITNQRLLGALSQLGGTDQLVTRESRNVIAVLTRKSSEFAHCQIEGAKEAYFKDARIDALDCQRNGIILCIFMQQAEHIVVLPVKVQQARSTVGIWIGNFEVLRKGYSMREGCVDIP